MRVLIVSNLFPNASEPQRGLFNKQQAAALAKAHDVTVIAPVPWLPMRRVLGRVPGWARYANVPQAERIEGVSVHHPRYVMTPKIGRALYGMAYFLGIRRTAHALHAVQPFDVILATWAYPDVFGAVLLARALRVPLVAKVHGSDVNLVRPGSLRQRLSAWALRRSAAVIAVSEGLKAALVRWGIEPDKITVIRNGVDFSRFAPMDRYAARRRLSLPEDSRHVVFIGNLTGVKGLGVLLEAMERLPDGVRLSLVGDGELQHPLEREAQALGFDGRVFFAGRVAHDQVPVWIAAADVVCLPSVHEGCPNVVVEALACGRPVVATEVGGLPELVRNGDCGMLVPARDAAALAEALQRSLLRVWDEERIRRAVDGQTWARNANAVAAMLRAAADGAACPRPRAGTGRSAASMKRLMKSAVLRMAPKRLLLSRGDRRRRVVALSFDDGPHPGHTERILAVLREEGVKATFFLVGAEVEKYPALARAIVRDGHAVGGHSWSHRRLSGVTRDELAKELEQTAALIQQTTGVSSRLVRPPYGAMSLPLLRYAAARGWTVVLWSVESGDHLPESSASALRAAAQSVGPGDIVLLHEDYPHTVEALRDIIQDLKAKALSFATVEELVESR